MFVELHNLVEEVRKARDAGDYNAARAKWIDVEEGIDRLTGYKSSERKRFSNLLYDQLDGQHTTSSSIDLKQLMEHVCQNPEAGKNRLSDGGVLY